MNPDSSITRTTPPPSWLLDSLRSQDIETCERAIESLSQYHHKDTAQALVEMFANEQASVRQKSARALASLGSYGLSALMKTLAVPNPVPRALAARALGQSGNPGALFALIRALEDSSEKVRINAAKALQRLAIPSSIPALKKALKDEDSKVKKAAARALKAIER